mgnify:FL=1
MGETDGFGEVVDLLVLYMMDSVCVAFAQAGGYAVQVSYDSVRMNTLFIKCLYGSITSDNRFRFL